MTKLAQHLFFFFLLTIGLSAVAQKKGKQLNDEEQLKFDLAFVNGSREKILFNYDDALKQFRYCYGLQPENAAVNFVIGDVYFQKKMYEDAERYVMEAVKLDKENIWYKELLVDVYIARKKSKEAAELMLTVAREKKEVQNMLQASYLFVMAKEYSKAIKVLEEVEKNVGINEDVVKQKEQIYLAQNKLPKAIKEVEKLIKAFPGETKYMGMLADLYVANGNSDKAVAIYNEILKKEPNNGFALFSLADYYRSKSESEKWYNLMKAGMASKDVDTKSKINVLSAFMAGKDFENQLERTFELATIFAEANQTEAAPYLVLGDLYAQQRKYDSARLEYRKALVIEPATYIGWQQLVFCSSQLLDNELLLKDCEDAIEYFPNEPAFFTYAAIASMQLKQYDKAVNHAMKGLETITPDQKDIETQLHATLADAYHYLKNHKASDSTYEAILKNDSQNAYAMNNYAYFLSLRKVNLEKAAAMSKRSLELDAENASYMDTYGWILYAQKDYAGAKEYIEKSLRYSPNNAEVCDHLGDVLYQLNDKEGALKSWKKAKELGSDSILLDKKIKDGKLYEE
ncbi:MAG: tetratricopeptide repeat protein [Bacteroidota bacterium]